MPVKKSLKKHLFKIGEAYLRKQGYTVSKVPGLGFGSIRQISKPGKKPRLASIRTTTDGHLAFEPKADGGFKTLDDVNLIIAVASNDWEQPNPKHPTKAFVHEIEAKALSKYFAHARKAREDGGRPPKSGVGMWLALYKKERPGVLGSIGCGFGNDFAPVDEVALDEPLTGEADDVTADSGGHTLKLDVGGVRISIEITPINA